jgi:1-acyl-sn-glycerol-3-phosphate acyltransferase
MSKLVFIVRLILFKGFLRPFLTFVMGVKYRYGQKIDLSVPTIFVANHNSHLDAICILASIPFHQIDKIHPVVAKDYFYRNTFMKYFFRFFLGSVSVERDGSSVKPLERCEKLLRLGHSLIIFPEGTRGVANEMKDFKNGVSYLLKNVPEATYIPIYCEGLGNMMPKGDWVLVPSKASIIIGKRKSIDRSLDAKMITALIKESILELKGAIHG